MGQQPLEYDDWLDLVRADNRKLRRGFNQISDLCLRMFWADGCEPKVGAILAFNLPLSGSLDRDRQS
jgi:hypothetical protein